MGLCPLRGCVLPADAAVLLWWTRGGNGDAGEGPGHGRGGNVREAVVDGEDISKAKGDKRAA